MMKIAMPTKMTHETIDRVMEINETAVYKIGEIYGSLPSLGWGSGRDPALLPQIDQRAFLEHIAAARAHGLHFNYVLNNVFCNNREYNQEELANLLRAMDAFVEAGTDVITLSNPFLIDMFCRRYKNAKINVSLIAKVKDQRQVDYYKKKGVGRITFHSDITRDIALVRSFARGMDCEVEILANATCLHECPMEDYHYLVLGNKNASHPDRWINYCSLNCAMERLRNPVELFRAGWIRPVDLMLYENSDIDVVKIVGREFPLDTISKVAYSYAHAEQLDDLGPLLTRYTTLRLPGIASPFYTMKIDGTRDDLYRARYQDVGKCDAGCAQCRVCYTMADELIDIKNREYILYLVSKLLDSHMEYKL